MKDFLREKYASVILIALMVAYSVFFSALSIQRHNAFRTNASDLGQMDQALWNTLHGNVLEDTRDNGDRTARQAPRLTDHVEPIFLVVPLVYLIYDGVEAILVLQSVVIALGALPIFWVARRRFKPNVPNQPNQPNVPNQPNKPNVPNVPNQPNVPKRFGRFGRFASSVTALPLAHLNDWAALAFAAMYLLFPALEAANLAEFHAVTLAPAPLLFAYNYAQERAWKRYALFSLLALAVKEEIALLVFAMAVWAMLTAESNTEHASRITSHVSRVPLFIAALSLAWFFIAVFVIVPRFAPSGRSVYVGRYTCASEAIKNPVMAVPQLIGCVLIPDKIAYVLQLLASVGFIALLDPIALLVGSPALIMNLLSSYPAQYSGTFHYSAPVAPYFVLAAIDGAFVIRNSKFVIQNSATRVLLIAVAPAFAVAVGYHAMAGYTPIGGEFFFPQVTPHQELFARFAGQIPRDVPVSTTASLFPHLSHRRFLYRFPTIQDADYILLDVSQAITKHPVDFRVDYLKALERGFGIRDALDGYILLQRGLPQKELPDGFFNFLRACLCTLPQERVVVDFEDKIRFLGYDVKHDDWGRVYLRTYWTRMPGMDNNNYALFPFFPDENGVPREDPQIPPLLVHFWYPTMRWQEGEVIVADTTPMDVGARAKIGVGVFFGATWEQPERRLAPHTDAPIFSDWVLIGELVRNGKRYEVVR